MANDTTPKETVEAPVATEAPATPPAAELTVQDLTAIKQIIDVASSRGAFKANEMAIVGQTYNTLETVLGAVSESKPQEEPKGE
jgi:hypothetical protein